VPTADRPGERVSRRSLLAAAGALTVGLAGCGSSGSGTRTNPEFRAADADVLDELLGVKNRAVAAYAHAAGLLGGPDRELATRIGVHEAAHVYAVTGAIYRLGGAPTPADPSYRFAAAGGPAALALAAQTEDTSIAALIDALPKLTDLEARGTIVSILDCDAQHAAVVAQARGLPPLATAVVRGQA
jgi:hypothetical protein